jgi:hypothetical protein
VRLAIAREFPGDEFYEHHPAGNYFQIERVEMVWRGFGAPIAGPYYRRPLSAMINPLLEAGFRLEHIREPQPVKHFRQHDPREYEKLMRQPGFICIRARKDECG